MNNINQIQYIFRDFRRWTENDKYATILNERLEIMNQKGLSKLSERFFKSKTSSSGYCTLFEIYICWGMLNDKNVKGIKYEPSENENMPCPDFRVMYDDKTVDIQAKVIMSLEREEIKERLLKEFSRRLNDSEYNYFTEIWISDDIEPTDINNFLEYYISELPNCSINTDYYFPIKVLPIVKFKLTKPQGQLKGNHLGIINFFGEADGLAKEVDLEKRRKKLKKVFDKSSKSFQKEIDNNYFNIVFVKPHNGIWFDEDNFLDSVYGTEIIGFNTSSEFVTHDRKNDGLFNGQHYSKLFGAIYVPENADLMAELKGTFAMNYKYISNIKSMPKLFNSMLYCLPKKLKRYIFRTII